MKRCGVNICDHAPMFMEKMAMRFGLGRQKAENRRFREEGEAVTKDIVYPYKKKAKL